MIIIICASSNLCMQALKQSLYEAGCLFDGCYFGDIMCL